MAGRARGRRLRVPASGTRPTSDRAREAVFSSLDSLRGGFSAAVVLDLYAGSGAMGLEALSRGAAHVDLVESDREAAKVIRANSVAVLAPDRGGDCAAAPRVEVYAITVERWLESSTRSDSGRASTGGASTGGAAHYDVVFCDPPYTTPADDVREVLAALVDRLTDDALIVVERAWRDRPWSWPDGLVAIKDRRYGEAHLCIGGKAPAAAEQGQSQTQ